MNITLKKDGQKKTFTQHFVSSKFMRKALELRKDMNLNNLSAENLDTVANFVVDVFDKQFNAEELYDGIPYEDFLDTIFHDIFTTILQGRKQELVEGTGNEKK